MKIAITGGTGFIGSCLAQKCIAQGDEVRLLTRKDIKKLNFDPHIKFFSGDLFDNEILAMFLENVDVLYHCAAEIKDENKMERTNVEGTANLIKVATETKLKHWVQLSSVGIYGPIQHGIVTEENAPNPISLYEQTKSIADSELLIAAQEKKFELTIIRPSNVYGSNMRNGSLFAFIKAIDNGLFFFIGPKGASANYIAVENVVNAMILCAKNANAKGKIYNISDWTTIEEFVKIASHLLNKPFPRFRLPLTLVKMIAKIGDKFDKIPLTTGRLKALTNTAIYTNNSIVNDLGYSNILSTQKGIEKFVLEYKKVKL